MDSKIALVYLTYNSEPEIKNNFSELVSKAGTTFSILAIDNASTDESIAALVKYGIIPLQMQENLGYTRGINEGLSLIPNSYDWIFLVNPDIVPVEEGWMVKMLHGIPDSCGIIGAMLLSGDNVIHGGGQILQEKVVSTWTVPYQIGDIILWEKEALGATRIAHKVGERFKFDKAELCPWVTFAVVALRRKMIEEIGLLNEDYFLYSSDVDFCFKAWDNDWEVWYRPVPFKHRCGASVERAPNAVKERGQQDIKLWLTREDEIIEKFFQRLFIA